MRYFFARILCTLLVVNGSAGQLALAGTDQYRFERFWPVLQQPWYFAATSSGVDDQGFIYVTDTTTEQVQKFTLQGQYVTQWGGRGTGPGQFEAPTGVAVDSDGNVFIADFRRNIVQKFTPNGDYLTEFGTLGSGPGQLNAPRYLVFDALDNLFVSEVGNSRVSRFSKVDTDDPTQAPVFDVSFGASGTGPGQFTAIGQAAVHENGDIFVVGTRTNRIQKFGPEGDFLLEFGTFGQAPGELRFPGGIAINRQDEVLVADAENRIQAFDLNGNFIREEANIRPGDRIGLSANTISITRSDDLILTDRNTSSVVKTDFQGILRREFGSPGSSPGRFLFPQSAAEDPLGRIIVSDVASPGPGGRYQAFDSQARFLFQFQLAEDFRDMTYGANGRLYGVRSNVYAYEALAAGQPAEPPALVYSVTDIAGTFPVLLVGNAGGDQIVLQIENVDINDPVILPGAQQTTTQNMAFADFDGDRQADFVFGRLGTNVIEITEVQSFGGGQSPLSTDSDDTRAVAVLDANDDGSMDIITGNVNAPNRLFLNDGSGGFSFAASIGNISDDALALSVADVDDNGSTDIFIGNANGQSRIYLNDGSGNFSAGQAIGDPTDSIVDAQFVDVDRNGTFDLVVGKDGTNQVYLNNGGSFSTPVDLSVDSHDTRALATADVNLDGFVDVIAGNYNQTNRYYLNSGDGRSWAGVDIGVETESTTSLAVNIGRIAPTLFAGNEGQPNRAYLLNRNFDSDTPFSVSVVLPAEGLVDTLALMVAPKTEQAGRVNATKVDISPNNHLYVLSPVIQTVTRFNGDGLPMAETQIPRQPGEAAVRLFGLAVDDNDRIFVTDRYNRRIHRLDPPADLSGNEPHTLAFTFGDPGAGEGQLTDPGEIEVLDNGNLVVADDQTRLQVFAPDGQYLSSFGEQGLTPGAFDRILGIEALDDGRIAVVDQDHNRVQLFSPEGVTDNTKAIIVAGGGPYPGNALWDATQNNANFAYRVLVSQGFTKESIWYLSADTELDLDGNGAADDVDADTSVANLADALDNFAADADNLIVYLVDHGGLDTFRMSGTETLASGILGGLLDAWHSAHPAANLTAIYDACQAGSFLEELRSDEFDRIVITSSGALENAYFVSQGSLSFSNQFWTHIFNGLSLENAYNLASQSQSTAFPEQTPMVEANGDGMANTALDFARLANQFIGNGTQISGEAPQIGALTISPPSGSSATIALANVTDADGIARVWAVLRPPGFNPGSADNPVQELPTIELSAMAGGNDYTTTFEGFTSEGTYQITAYAQDAIGNTAVPMVGFLSINNPLRRKAIVVAAGDSSDALAGTITTNAGLAYSALLQQGYGPDGGSCASALCDDIQFLSNSGVVGLDGAASLLNLEFAITDWATQGGRDLVLYLVGTPEAGGLRLNSGEILSVGQLNGWLDTAQQSLPGAVVVLYDGELSGEFVAGLAPPSGVQRVIIASDGDPLRCNLVLDDDISFSRYFWGQVLNGATVRQAFNVARQGIRYSSRSQRPVLDDDGNGIGNEFSDGLFSRNYSLGSGVLLAGDEPLVAAVNAPAAVSGASPVEIEALGVTSTGSIDTVEAIVTLPSCEEIRLPMQPAGESRFVVQTQAFADITGQYDVAVIARDDEGLTSLPVVTRVIQTAGGQLFLDGFESQ